MNRLTRFFNFWKLFFESKIPILEAGDDVQCFLTAQPQETIYVDISYTQKIKGFLPEPKE